MSLSKRRRQLEELIAPEYLTMDDTVWLKLVGYAVRIVQRRKEFEVKDLLRVRRDDRPPDEPDPD